jgi:pyruvate kinase
MIESSLELAQLQVLTRELGEIRSELIELEREFDVSARGLHPAHHDSARNLLHYLALRRRDIRELQGKLAALGLSSLGRAEAQVMLSLEAVLKVLHRITGDPWQSPVQPERGIRFVEGKALLESHTEALLGAAPSSRPVRIMVTMPSEAARDYHLVKDLLNAGMSCMRINCAHDDKEAWAQMIANLRRARRRTHKSCRVLMDLAGPKLRTGPIEPGPRVIKIGPRRDHFGHVVAPARICLTSSGASDKGVDADAHLPLKNGRLDRIKAGDTIRFFDARGASRALKVIETEDEKVWAESYQTAYVTPGTALTIPGRGPDRDGRVEMKVAELPAKLQEITLKRGDRLILTQDSKPGRSAVYDEQGKLSEPARIGITLPEVFDDIKPGEAIWIDDGKIGGRIVSVGEKRAEIEITHARVGGSRLMADKGINLPESALRLPSLTSKDLADLRFIAANADIVGYSFVRTESDVFELQERLEELGGEQLGIVLKVETIRAFENLPGLLLAAMRSPCAGVMIARGDLAIECGFERMAEVQEEILWICEAAHMPVIWATQVLEKLAKEGLPSRAEITDAAMGERAECVMLNKGPYIVEAVRALDDIMRRMQAHQRKKSAMLRPLSVAFKFTQTA